MPPSGRLLNRLVAIIWFLRIHRSQISTSNQSQGECLRSDNHLHHSDAYTAGSSPPSHSMYWAVHAPPCRWRTCSYLIRYVQAQTVNNDGEQTTTEPKNAPPLSTSNRRNKKSDNKKQCKNKELDRAREKTTGQQKCLTVIITLVSVQDALKWLNWFREIM